MVVEVESDTPLVWLKPFVEPLRYRQAATTTNVTVTAAAVAAD